MKNRFSFSLALLLGIASVCSAQWSMNLYVNPFPPAYVSEWETTPGIATLSITYTGDSPKTVKIWVSLTGDVRGAIVTGVSDPITFQPGETKSISNTEFSGYSGITDYPPELSEQITRSGRLPEDTYELCCDCKDASTEELYAHQCASFTISAPSPPSLIYPSDDDTILTANPIFQWSAVSAPSGYTVAYNFRLCKVNQGQTKIQAISNTPVDEKETENITAYPYPPTATPLDTGSAYVWQVQALDEGGYPIGENDGKSEIWGFVYKIPAPEKEFEVTKIKPILPDTISVEDTVKAKIEITIPEGTSGHVVGAFYIDDSLWQNFEKDISGIDTLETTKLPTDSTKKGSHSFKTAITQPNSKDTTVSYLIKAPKKPFLVSKLKPILPDTLFVGQTITAKLEVTTPEGTSGHCVGAFRIDGTHWQDFGQDISGTDTVETLPLATDSTKIGKHNFTAMVTEPNEKDTTISYYVKVSAGVVPGLDSLIVVPDLAYLYNIEGTAKKLSATEYIIQGTGLLKIRPFDSESLTVDIDSLKIDLNTAHPESSDVEAGKLAKEASEGDTLFSLYQNSLRVSNVEFAAPSTQLTIDAKLFLPYLGGDSPLLTLNDIIVTENGIEGKGFSTTQQFTLCGLTFGIKDVLPHKAIEIGYIKEDKIFWVSLSGMIKLTVGDSTYTLTQFTGFRFDISKDDFDVTGNFALADPFKFIPGNKYVLLDSLTFASESPDWYLFLKGKVNLPSPFDTLGARKFKLKVDMDGNMVGGINVLGPEEPGLGKGDVTEFDLWIVKFDLTYLGLKMKLQDGDLVKNECEVQLMADLYFPISGDTTKTKVSFGKKEGTTIYPGLTVDFDGNVEWKPEYLGAIDILKNKKIDLKIVYIDSLNLGIQPIPFEFVIGGEFGIDLSKVKGGVKFTGLRINLDGDFVNIGQAITGGSFNVYDVLDIGVDTVAFGGDTTLTYQKDASSSDEERRNGNGSTDTTSIEVDSYFKLTGANIALGNGGSIASGKFKRLLVYKKEGDRKFFINGVNLTIVGTKLLSDFEYSNPCIRIAGAVTLPNGIGGMVVGKLGQNASGDPSFGLFLGAQDLNILLYASVYLNDLGGGFFYNPETADIDAVRNICEFSREKCSTLEEAGVDKKIPSPGSFGILLYAGIYVAQESLVEGRALMSLTENYWSLDAEITALEEKCKGNFYLDISWSPAYAQGEFNIDIDFYSIVKGEGGGGFYVYGSDAWGVMASGNLKILPSINYANLGVDFFVGPPGFMLDVEYSAGINIYVLSGGIEYEIMFWWHKNVSWGAYADLYAHGEILGGLVGVGGGLEGAFIGAPDLVIYAVGRFKAKICWVTVFKGSIWISMGSGGLDGGTGRNSRYDELIEDARNMADEMEEEMDSLQARMDEALNALFTMSEEQIERAGATLVNALLGPYYLPQRQGIMNMYTADKNQAAPNDILNNVYHGVIFSPAMDGIKTGRDALQDEATGIQETINLVSEKNTRVEEKLREYESLLEGELPEISELGVMNPVGAATYTTMTVGDSTITFQNGFGFNESQATENMENTIGTKEDIAAYQDMLFVLVDKFDSNIDTIDYLLYSGEDPVHSLSNDYTNSFEDLNDYYVHLFDYLGETSGLAASMIMSLWSCESNIQTAVHSQTEKLLAQGLPAAPLGMIKNLIGYRENLLHMLDSTFTTHYPDIIDDPNDTTNWMNACDSTGMLVWHHIPRAAYLYIVNNNSATRDTAKNTFRETRNDFSTNWVGYTKTLSGIYERESRLYEILYDLYDQLSICVTPPPPGGTYKLPGGTYVPPGGTFLPPGGTYKPLAMGASFAELRDNVAKYLEMPTITTFSGSARSDNIYYSNLNLSFGASHPKGLSEYSYRLVYPATGGFFFIFYPIGWTPPFRSVGLKPNTHLTLLWGVDSEGEYTIYLRARGRGGYAITRKGLIDVNYFSNAPDDPNAGIVQESGINVSDNTAPATPVVTDDGEFTSSTNMLHCSWRSTDYESGIQEYKYAVGERHKVPIFTGPPGSYVYVFEPTVKDWTSAGGMKELNIRDLNLENGETYFVGVKAKNGIGLWSPVGYSDGITVDITPPTKPEIQRFETYKEPNTLYAGWSESQDAESGVAGYEYAIGRTLLGTELKDWTYRSSIYRMFYEYSMPLHDGDTCWVSVKAINGAGLSSEPATSSIVIHFEDKTPPRVPTITASFTPSRKVLAPGTLRATWSSYDAQSGITEYQYQIEAEIKKVLIPWTSVGTSTSLETTISGLPEYIKVKAINGVGLESVGEATTR